jgi:hypothetical protein
LFIIIHDIDIFIGEMNHIYWLNFVIVKETAREIHFADIIKHQSYSEQVTGVAVSDMSFMAWIGLISITLQYVNYTD